MQAIRFHAPGQPLVLDEVPLPTPGVGDALVRVNSVAICGSDLHIIEGHTPVGYTPITLGHEISGVVAALGPESTGPAIGTRVFINPVVGCQACEYCMSGQSNVCPNRKILGIHREGGLAEFVVAPARNLTAMPENAPFDEIALIESAGTANHALRKLNVNRGDAIVVIGVGGLGRQVLELARWRGVQVIALDGNPGALERAERAGALAALNSFTENVSERILELTAGAGVDGAVDCVGIPATFTTALELLKPGATLSVVGIGSEPLTTLEPAKFIRRSLNVSAIYAYTERDISDVAQAVTDGAIVLNDAANATFPMSQIDAAITLFSDKTQAPARVILTVSN